MAKLIIVAAGNGTRMGTQTFPKVLHPILGSTNLERTYGFAYDLFDEICVVVKMNDKKTFERFKLLNKMNKLTVIPIVSGKGDGHAVLEALTFMSFSPFDPLVIMWGDAVLMGPEVLQEMLDFTPEGVLYFPVRYEELPYVWFQQDDDGYVSSANFSKKGEVIPEGYHDQSIFGTKDVLELRRCLDTMDKVQRRNEQYLTGGELNFLHVIHYLYNDNKPSEMFETQNQVFAFNTVLEAETIEAALHKTVKPV